MSGTSDTSSPRTPYTSGSLNHSPTLRWTSWFPGPVNRTAPHHRERGHKCPPPLTDALPSRRIALCVRRLSACPHVLIQLMDGISSWQAHRWQPLTRSRLSNRQRPTDRGFRRCSHHSVRLTSRTSNDDGCSRSLREDSPMTWPAPWRQRRVISACGDVVATEWPGEAVELSLPFTVRGVTCKQRSLPAIPPLRCSILLATPPLPPLR